MARKSKVRTFTQERQLSALSAIPGRHRDEKSPGLYLQVMEGKGEANRVSWLFRYQLHGRERWAGFGPLGLVSLKDAREKVMAARRQLLDGIDPLKAKADARAERVKADAATVTFEAAAQGYYDAQSIKWRNPKHRASISKYPAGRLPIRSWASSRSRTSIRRWS